MLLLAAMTPLIHKESERIRRVSVQTEFLRSGEDGFQKRRAMQTLWTKVDLTVRMWASTIAAARESVYSEAPLRHKRYNSGDTMDSTTAGPPWDMEISTVCATIAAR